MHTFFDTVPSAAAKAYPDGHLYAFVRSELYQTTTGKVHVRESEKPRMLRVSHILRGVAFIEIGKAGDAIAATDNLPFSVMVEHARDDVGGLLQ